MAVNRFYFFGSYSGFRPFIMKVNSGADSQITIPTFGGGYNYDLSSSDGQSWTGLTGNHTINFPSANTDYVIEISGLFPRININNNSEKDKFLDIKQCGDIEWLSFANSFFGCSNLVVSATDTPNITNATNFIRAFSGTDFNTNVNSWDWSNIENMEQIWQNGVFNNGGVTLDISVPKLGINGNTAINFAFQNTPIEGIILRDINYDVNFGSATLATPNLTILELHGCFGNVDIRNTALTGGFIDNLFTSLRDITALPAKSITITTAQSTSGIDTTIATSKGWTIVIV